MRSLHPREHIPKNVFSGEPAARERIDVTNRVHAGDYQLRNLLVQRIAVRALPARNSGPELIHHGCIQSPGPVDIAKISLRGIVAEKVGTHPGRNITGSPGVPIEVSVEA